MHSCQNGLLEGINNEATFVLLKNLLQIPVFPPPKMPYFLAFSSSVGNI